MLFPSRSVERLKHLYQLRVLSTACCCSSFSSKSRLEIDAIVLRLLYMSTPTDRPIETRGLWRPPAIKKPRGFQQALLSSLPPSPPLLFPNPLSFPEPGYAGYISCWKSNLFNSRFMVCPEASTKDKFLAKHSFKMCETQCWCFGRLKICAIGSTYTPNNLVRLKIMHWHCFWVICMLSAYIIVAHQPHSNSLYVSQDAETPCCSLVTLGLCKPCDVTSVDLAARQKCHFSSDNDHTSFDCHSHNKIIIWKLTTFLFVWIVRLTKELKKIFESYQEPITRSVHPPYWVCEPAFDQIRLFLE